MRGYPPSTIYRYLDLPSTQIIQTHNTHRHNSTQPSHTLAQAAHPLPSNTTATKTHTYPTFPIFLQDWQSTNPILSTYDMTTDYNKTNRHSPTTRKLTGHNSRKTHRVRFRSDHHTHQYTHCQHNFYKHHTDGRQAQHTKGQDA